MIHLSFELETFRVPRHQVSLFAKQLSLLLNSGIGLVAALEILAVQEEYPKFGEIIELLSGKLLQGYTLSHAMTFFPLAFPPTLRALVRVGEQTGGLHHTLASAGDWLERDSELYAKLRSSLAYPLFVLGFALLLTVVLFTTVVPQFLSFLSASRMEVPLPTMIVMFVAQLLLNPGTYLLLAGMIGMTWLYAVGEMAVPGRASLWTSRLYALPFLGEMFRMAALTRFSFSASTLLSRGTTLDRAVVLAAGASNSPLLREDARRLVLALENGETLAQALGEEKQLYGERLVQFVEVGEESAKLPFLLERAGSLFQLELDLSLEKIPVLLEPIILSFLGGMVATILLSLFLPLYAALGA